MTLFGFLHVLSRDINTGCQQESESGNLWGGPLPPSPLTPKKPKKTNKKKGVGRFYYCFLTVLTHCQLRRWVWSRIVAVVGLADVLHPAVVAFSPSDSVQGGSVYRTQSGVQGFPYSCRKLWACML
jgi:hypothetical protein